MIGEEGVGKSGETDEVRIIFRGVYIGHRFFYLYFTDEINTGLQCLLPFFPIRGTDLPGMLIDEYGCLELAVGFESIATDGI